MEKPDRFSIISVVIVKRSVADDPRVCIGDLQTGYVLPGERNVMGFGVSGKLSQNKRETEIRLSSRISRDVHSGIGRATGRCVRNQIGFMAQTESSCDKGEESRRRGRI